MQPKNYKELYEAVDKKEIISAVTKDGKKHRLFISTSRQLCHFIPKSSRRGFVIHQLDFDNYSKFIGKSEPKSDEEKLKKQYNVIAKYKRMAMKSSFSNDWIEDCKNLPTFEDWKKDLNIERNSRQKGLYDYNITTGNKIDGKVISLDRINKQFPRAVQALREAISTQNAVGKIISRTEFAGYEMTISVEQKESGIMGYLSLEYKGCGNGYYYLLINDENFIGYDVD